MGFLQMEKMTANMRASVVADVKRANFTAVLGLWGVLDCDLQEESES